jgi:apolipoprotein N-acyltransferase
MLDPRLARPIALAAATGLLYPLCFPDFDLGGLAWVVLVPLHLAIGDREVTPRRAFWLGWLAGALAFTGVMAWVVTAMHQYGKVPLRISWALLLLLAAYLGLYVAVYALGLSWLNRRLPQALFLAAPALWVTLEWIRTWLFSGLPWALLGYAPYKWLPAIQIADITSVYGLSFLIVLVNVAVSEALGWARAGWRARPGPRLPFPWPSLTAAAVLTALTLSYGFWRLAESEAAAPASIRIGIVQANIDQAQKWDASYRRATVDRYKRLTGQAVDGNDLVLWPEAATPFLFEMEKGYKLEVMDLVRTHRKPLLFGSPALRYYPNGRPYLLNSAYLLSEEGTMVGRYDKRHLVPFGEYIPLHSSVLFFLDKLVEGIGDFEAGTAATVLPVPGAGSDGVQPDAAPGRFGVVICYEVIFPNLVRDFAEAGADFMVTITNDAWFGASAAPYQHFGMVVLRAVENRRAFARAANTGISGFIDPQGRILSATKIFEEAAVGGRIPLERRLTFYSRHGDVFAYACVIITALFFLLARRRGGKQA